MTYNTWFLTYRKLAETLSEFYKVHGREAKFKLFDLLNGNPYFLSKNKWFSKAIYNYKAKSIDPIQLYASFNSNSAPDSTRIEILRNIFNLLDVEIEIVYNKDFFNGCPTPNIVKIITSREVFYQDQIWQIFNNIVDRNKDTLTQESFDLMSFWYGIDIISFTIFLNWVDSEHFLPVDNNTIGYLISTKFINNRPRNFNDYKKLNNSIKDGDLKRELVHVSYQLMSEKKELLIFPPVVNEFIKEQGSKDKNIDTSINKQNFKLIAIRPLFKNEKD
jgi:hypothetical protein